MARLVIVLRRTLKVIIAMLWTASAYAAEPILAAVPSLTDLPWRAVAAAAILAIIGGAARTAQKIVDQKIPLSLVAPIIFADLLTALTVGMATFFLVAWREFHPLLQAFVITVAGYGGSTILEKYVMTIVRRIDASGNNDNNGGGNVKS